MINYALTWPSSPDTKLRRTKNFLSPSPEWEAIGNFGSTNAVIHDAAIDWHCDYITSGGQSGGLGIYVATTLNTDFEVYYIPDILADTVTQMLLFQHPTSGTGTVGNNSASIAVSREIDGLVGVNWAEDGGYKYVESTDGGDNWGSVQTIGASVTPTFKNGNRRFAIHGNNRLAIGVDSSNVYGIYLSTNGTSFSKVLDSIASVYTICIKDNSTAFYLGYETVYRIDDYDTTPTVTNITPSGFYAFGLSLDPHTGTLVITGHYNVGGWKLYTSVNDGANWDYEQSVIPMSIRQISATNLIAISSSGLQPNYSPDGGSTFFNKHGNLGTSFYAIGMITFFDLLPLEKPNHDNFSGSDACHAISEPSTATDIGLLTGEKRLEVTDLALNTPAGPLTFTRTYRQFKQDDAHYQFMGLGWSHNHNIRLVEDTTVTPNVISVRMPGGSEVRFSKTATNTYEGDPGSTAVIEVNPGSSSARYTLTTQNKHVFVFEVVGANSGRLVSRTWNTGETWLYSYDGSDNLTDVIDDSYDLGSGVKRKLTFTYYTSGAHSGQLQRVTDHSGRYVEFDYISDHDSGTFSLLDTATDVLGNDWTYEYEDTISAQLNFLIKTLSPLVDTTGNGTPDSAITLEELTYTVSGGEVTAVTEKIGKVGSGSAVQEKVFNFGLDGLTITGEQIAGQTIKHRFAGGVYTGTQDPLGNGSFTKFNSRYLATDITNARGFTQQVIWDDTDPRINKVRGVTGEETDYSYDSDQRLQQVIDPEARKTTYGYNPEQREPTLILIGQSGTELAIDGDMELTTGWSNVGSPSTNARVDATSHQVDSGTYSRHVVANSGDGIESASWTMQADKTYVIMARVYPVNSGDVVKMNVSGMTNFDQTSSGNGSWQTLRAIHTPTSSGSKTLRFLANSTTAEFYVDSVHLMEVTALESWQEMIFDSKLRLLERTKVNVKTGLLQERTTYTYGNSGKENGLRASETRHDVEDAANTVSVTYTYDDLGRVVKAQRSSMFGSCTFTYTVYDAANNVVAKVCGRQNTTAPTTVMAAIAMYDANDSLKKHNRVTVYEYDYLGRRIKTTTDAGASFEKVSLTVYNGVGQVVRTIDNYVASGSVPSPYTATHNAFGHGADNTQNLVKDFLYNEAGLLAKQTDVEGNVALMGYDLSGRLVKVIQSASSPSYDNFFLTGDYGLTSYTPSSDADKDIITLYGYDAENNLVASVDPLGNVDYTVYDAENRPIKVVASAKDTASVFLNPGSPGYDATNDPRSDSYVPSDDPDRDIIVVTEYDKMGRVIRTKQLTETRPNAVWSVTLVGYDEEGRQVTRIGAASAPDYDIAADPDLSGYTRSSVADEDIVVDVVYDDRGYVLHDEDVNGNRTWTAYDGLGRRIKSINNAVGTATDGSSNDPRSSSYSPSSDPDKDLITTSEYDTDGRVQRTQDVLGRWMLYGYDELGRQVRTVRNASDPDYFSTVMTPDPDLSGYTPSSNSDEDLVSDTVYDDEGRVQQRIDHRGNVTYMVYDELGRTRMTISNYVVQGSSVPEDWVWDAGDARWEDGATNPISRGTDNDQNLIRQTTYDLVGRSISTLDAVGIKNQTTYDAIGRAIKTIRNYVDGTFSSSTPDEDVISLTTYNKGGQVIETTDARGTKTTFTYDAAGRRLTVTRASGTGLQATDYTCYDKAGRVLRTLRNWRNDPAQADPDAMDGSGDWLFVPDNHGMYADRDLVTEFTYDKVGRRLTTVDPLGYSVETTYDQDGQVQAMTDVDNYSTVYRYDALRRPLRIVQNYVAQGATDPADWVWDAGDSRWEES